MTEFFFLNLCDEKRRRWWWWLWFEVKTWYNDSEESRCSSGEGRGGEESWWQYIFTFFGSVKYSLFEMKIWKCDVLISRNLLPLPPANLLYKMKKIIWKIMRKKINRISEIVYNDENLGSIARKYSEKIKNWKRLVENRKICWKIHEIVADRDYPIMYDNYRKYPTTNGNWISLAGSYINR